MQIENEMPEIQEEDVLLTVRVIKNEKHPVTFSVAAESNQEMEQVVLLEVFNALHTAVDKLVATQESNVLNSLIELNREGRKYMNDAQAQNAITAAIDKAIDPDETKH